MFDRLGAQHPSGLLESGLLLLGLLTSSVAVGGAEIVYSDGRREAVVDPRKDAQGRWLAVVDGHLTTLKAGDVVVIVDAAGKETVTIPPLDEGADPPETATLLASLCDPKNEGWQLETAERLATKPTRGIHDALVKLTTDRSKETRTRAIHALARQRTKEGVMAAAAAVLAEKDPALHRDAASVLFSVEEIFKRCDSAQAVAAGLADKDPLIRNVFAMLSPRDLEAATVLLRTEGLKNGDHHVRESSAVELGRRGDRAGEALLISMLARTKMPGVDDAALGERLLIREQVELCAILGTFGTANAKAALKKAASSPFEPVRKAAAGALAQG